jgi:hypothetical protein
LFQHGGASPVDRLNRVLIAATAVGIVSAALAYAFVPKPAEGQASSPARRGVTGSQ